MVRVFFSLCLPDKHSGEVQRNRLRKSCPQGMVGVSIFKLAYYLNSHYIVNFKWPIKRQKYTTYFISLQNIDTHSKIPDTILNYQLGSLSRCYLQEDFIIIIVKQIFKYYKLPVFIQSKPYEDYQSIRFI